jgi:hypothetical protein
LNGIARQTSLFQSGLYWTRIVTIAVHKVENKKTPAGDVGWGLSEVPLLTSRAPNPKGGQPVVAVLASLDQVDDPVDDDFGH